MMQKVKEQEAEAAVLYIKTVKKIFSPLRS